MGTTLSRRAALAALAATLALWAPAPAVVGGTQGARAASCEGDECQPPEPAPEDPAPGSAVVRGPGDPPVHFEADHPKKPPKKKHKHHRHHKRSGR